MTTSCLQEKIDKLQNTVHALLHKSNYMAGVYVDDLGINAVCGKILCCFQSGAYAKACCNDGDILA